MTLRKCPRSALYPEATRRQLLKATAGIFMLPLAAGTALAASPEGYVTSLANQVMALARSGKSGRALKSRFVSLLTRSANMHAIARFALGKYRRKMPRSMQAEYYRLVIDYIAGLFVYYRKDLAASKLVIKRTTKRGKWITVDTDLVFANGAKSPVKWRISGSGSYRVGDVNIKGIWLSLRMRDKFVSILNRSNGDFGALMTYLRENSV